MKKVSIWTDGGCSPNPGPGGWCAILVYRSTEKVISGGRSRTTNNIMEMTAVIEALKILKEKCDVTLYSDSAYVVNAINLGWLKKWSGNDFTGADNKPVKNRELWEELDKLLKGQKVHFVKVKGHSDNKNNNRCDETVGEEIRKIRSNPDTNLTPDC